MTDRSSEFVGAPALPDGVDSTEYERIRARMRVSVLNVWKGDHVIAGMDPWSVVDEAWASMATSGFRSAGPFLPFALRVAHNKAVDALKRAEVRRGDRSLDAPMGSDDSDPFTLADVVPGSVGADREYFDRLEHQRDVERVALAEEAIVTVLSGAERDAFLAVQRDGKSRAAVGRDLDPPVTGQRVGQIVAAATVKILAYVEERMKENHV